MPAKSNIKRHNRVQVGARCDGTFLCPVRQNTSAAKSYEILRRMGGNIKATLSKGNTRNYTTGRREKTASIDKIGQDSSTGYIGDAA